MKNHSTTQASKRRLPDTLKPFFWEYDFRALNWNDDRDLVIQRILTTGDWHSIRWLRSELGDAELKAWLYERRGRGLDPRRLRFWQNVLRLPRRDVTAWIASQKQRI